MDPHKSYFLVICLYYRKTQDECKKSMFTDSCSKLRTVINTGRLNLSALY